MGIFKIANFRYYLLLHLIVLAWGFTGILGKLIMLNPFQIVFYRMLIGGVSLLIFLLLAGKKVWIKDKKQLLKVLGVGLVVAGHWLSFFQAIQVSTVSLGVLCLASTALHVSWLEPIVMKRKFFLIEFVLGLIVVLGVLFVSGKVEGEGNLAGLLWGLTSAVLAAGFVVFNARLNKDGIPSGSLTVYEMLTGTIILLIFLGLTGRLNTDFFVMTQSDFLWLLFLGIICTSVAFMLAIEIVARIGSYSSSLTANLEPVYSIILAIIILSEDKLLDPGFYFGTLVIIGVVFANHIIKNKVLKSRKKKNSVGESFSDI